jgi:splicing factor 3B subunit 3
LIELENNEAGLSMAICNFTGYEETFLCLGSVKRYRLSTQREFDACYVHTFSFSKKLDAEGNSVQCLTLVHTTELDDIPQALTPWRGKILIGVGSSLRCYEMGKKKLLKKAELKNLNSVVNGI